MTKKKKRKPKSRSRRRRTRLRRCWPLRPSPSRRASSHLRRRKRKRKKRRAPLCRPAGPPRASPPRRRRLRAGLGSRRRLRGGQQNQRPAAASSSSSSPTFMSSSSPASSAASSAARSAPCRALSASSGVPEASTAHAALNDTSCSSGPAGFSDFQERGYLGAAACCDIGRGGVGPERRRGPTAGGRPRRGLVRPYGPIVVPRPIRCLRPQVKGRLRRQEGGRAAPLELGDGVIAAAEAVEGVRPRERDVICRLLRPSTAGNRVRSGRRRNVPSRGGGRPWREGRRGRRGRA